ITPLPAVMLSGAKHLCSFLRGDSQKYSEILRYAQDDNSVEPVGRLRPRLVIRRDTRSALSAFRARRFRKDRGTAARVFSRTTPPCFQWSDFPDRRFR